PSTSDPLALSVALCAHTSSALQFFVTNSSDVDTPGPDGVAGGNVWELVVDPQGLGNWTGLITDNGGKLAIWNASSSDSLELGASNSGLLHEHPDALPFLGDTTSNQGLLFSPPFSPPPLYQPSYPNYTLPVANITPPSPPSNVPNFTLLLSPTSAQNLTALPQTACALRGFAAGNRVHPASGGGGNVLEEQQWLRDADGWRTEWLVGGLTPLTNYTAYTIQDQTKVNGPIYFTTKSASFSCPLVHALPYCPRTAYAAPLPAPPSPALAYTAASFPQELSTPLLSYLTNFTASLLTLACGREYYSPLQSCADCQRAYRDWLCAVQLPRCTEAPPVNSSTTTTSSSTSTSGARQTDGAQVPFPALLPQPYPASSSLAPRNPALAAALSGNSKQNQNQNQNYTALLPCLETCHAADRACPAFLGFKCPRSNFGANASYGVGYVDDEERGAGMGTTGAAQDRYGNVWCN
ncbi:hypothetical protein DENSPDRAFT_760503, partial [Dentipellis sp. KUC8613]